MTQTIMPAINGINGITDQDDLDLVFQKEFNKLSESAKNILYDLDMISFATAHDYYFNHQGKIDFMHVRNVGIKKNAELIVFFDALKEYFGSHYEINKEETDHKINFPEGSYPSNQNQTIPVFDNKLELMFQAKLKEISYPAQVILKLKNAHTIQGFYHYFFIENPDSLNFDIKDRRALVTMQIINLKRIVNEIIDQYRSDSIKPGLFSDLEFYFLETDFVKSYRREIFKRMMNNREGKQYQMYEEAAKDLNLTSRKVSQVAREFSKKIRKVLTQFIRNGYLEINHYFKYDYFIIDDVYAETINKREGTHFRKHVICYVLSHTLPDDYGFYGYRKMLPGCSGIFYRKDVVLNIHACLDLIRKLYLKPRQSKLPAIELEKIIEQSGFNMKSEDRNSSILQVKEQLVKILGLYNHCLPERSRQVEFNSDFLILKHKSGSKKERGIVEVLRANKKPLHYKAIYQRLIDNNLPVKSCASVHSTLIYSEKFVLKGNGYYGLPEWGGYSGKIGDVTEQILVERNAPINRVELYDILCRELKISRDSITNVLFNYKNESRFMRYQNDMVALKRWFNELNIEDSS